MESVRLLSLIAPLLIGCGASEDKVAGGALVALESEAHRLSNALVERGRTRNTDGFEWVFATRHFEAVDTGDCLRDLAGVGQAILKVDAVEGHVLAWRRFLDAYTAMNLASQPPQTESDWKLMEACGARLWRALNDLCVTYGWDAESGPDR